jgi:hypothetical protein
MSATDAAVIEALVARLGEPDTRFSAFDADDVSAFEDGIAVLAWGTLDDPGADGAFV